MDMIVIVVFLLLFAVGGVVFFLRRPKKTKEFSRYNEKPLLTKSETVLFRRMCRALPNSYIFPHITLSALLEPTKSKLEHFDRIAALNVDFAVYDGDLVLACIVVLEPDPPDSAKNKLMDRCLKSAGIKIIRWSAATKPSVEQISKSIGPLTNNTLASLEASNNTINPNSILNPNTVQRIHKDDPVSSNIAGLTSEQLDELTPGKVISKNYPHIWQRICLFAPEPRHLQKYLLSLSIQDRGEKRAGFPIEALKEIADIQTENDRFLLHRVTGWQPAFINR